jgi:hypothetical protein
VWFALFAIALVVGMRWGLFAMLGLIGCGTVALSVLVTRGVRKPVMYWFVQASVAAVSLALLLFAVAQR